ncbi:MAG: M23 family metallopeptidase [Bacteroidales bacterium]|nr:M23 family metallopeptidase [Bacteroidales bacterium]
MFRKKRYELNEQTLAYELHRTPLATRFSRGFVLFLFSVAAFACYYLLFTQYFGLEAPKTILLKQKYVELNSKYELLERKFGQSNQALEELQMRDNNIYRPIFGMEELSQDVREAGFGGVNRYAHLEMVSNSPALLDAVKRMDVIYKKAFVQSRSYDEVGLLAKRADEMAQCVPAIPPVALDNARLSSLFGYRKDPFSGALRMHQGIDLSGNKGEPIYAAGNGTVVEVRSSFFGYGREIVVDHGFGYKTRYAHLQKMLVKVGDVVERGEQIATMGNTGKSKGVHLHYEVIYRDRRVNPLNYYNQDIKGDEYMAMVRPRVNGEHTSVI